MESNMNLKMSNMNSGKKREGYVSLIRVGGGQYLSASLTKATLKINFVSCPAGGRNYGHLGSRNFFFSFFFFFFW